MDFKILQTIAIVNLEGDTWNKLTGKSHIYKNYHNLLLHKKESVCECINQSVLFPNLAVFIECVAMSGGLGNYVTGR